jgi:hypothetical protein
MARRTIFLLSPAHCGGKRAKALLDNRVEFPLARGLRSPGGVPLGEVFSFISPLYFRGKLSYASRFGSPGGVHIITTNRGLMAPETPVTIADIRTFGSHDIVMRDAVFREPLQRDLRRLTDDVCVLLGSIATDKYLNVLSGVLGERLYYPADFVGRGDMSRGSILLEAANAGAELAYVMASGAPVRAAATG